ncbi:MAG: peptidoglycan-associated lipoprotein [Candidatus Aminicenantes bacterium RBG_16_63_16]|nr:MAG: peptidoglycan-associated lipoprotein [Candidatus Aminicenantes bacterium RBG_16_63_16]
MLKKIAVLTFICALILAFSSSCKPKAKTTPPPPPAQEQPKVEKVDDTAAVKKPALTEEEIFMSKSLEQINLEAPLKMIHFDYDQYAIREDAKPTLEGNAAWLKKFSSAKILIEGHCDERGTEEYNLALGEKRAKTAYDYLASLGVPPDRMKLISYGKSQPLDTGHTETSWQKNRRAQFLIIEK